MALTSNAFAEYRKRCAAAGLADFLAKPFHRADLDALIDTWCAASRTSSRGGALDGWAA